MDMFLLTDLSFLTMDYIFVHLAVLVIIYWTPDFWIKNLSAVNSFYYFKYVWSLLWDMTELHKQFYSSEGFKSGHLGLIFV